MQKIEPQISKHVDFFTDGNSIVGVINQGYFYGCKLTNQDNKDTFYNQQECADAAKWFEETYVTENDREEY